MGRGEGVLKGCDIFSIVTEDLISNPSNSPDSPHPPPNCRNVSFKDVESRSLAIVLEHQV